VFARASTADLVREALAPELALRDLGELHTCQTLGRANGSLAATPQKNLTAGTVDFWRPGVSGRSRWDWSG
jgi:hypothetical protein